MAEGSVIGQSTVVRGNVRGEGSLEIYGQVEGDVEVTGDVTLGEQASVRGDISGARITVGGTVVGELRGTEAIVLESTAQATGDLTAPRIAIEEGARARGMLRMDEPGQSPPRASEQRRPAPRPAEAPVRRAPPERAEPPRAEPPRAVAAAPRAEPAASQKKAPPAPVVPAFRGLHGRKKKIRARN